MRRRQIYALQSQKVEHEKQKDEAPRQEAVRKANPPAGKGVKPCPKCGKPGYYFHLKACLK